MVSSIFVFGSLSFSILAVALSVYMYYNFQERINSLSGRVSDLKNEVNSLQIEDRALVDSVDERNIESGEMFEQNIRSLAERLFALLKTKHGVDDVTTYSELTDVLQDMDAEDDELKQELLEFYESAIRLEYSDEELSEEEKEKMKQTAIDLIKRTGQSLEQQE